MLLTLRKDNAEYYVEELLLNDLLLSTKSPLRLK